MPLLTKSSGQMLSAKSDSSPGFSMDPTADDLREKQRSNEIIVPARYPGRWIAAAVCMVLLVTFMRSVATNPGYEWPVVWRYLFSAVVVAGFVWTIALTVAAMGIGVLLGLVAALMRQSSNPILSIIAAAYIWL